MPGESAANDYQARRVLVYVEDLQSATAFYQEVLGFKATTGVDGVNLELETGGTPLVLHQGGSRLPEPAGLTGVVPSFQVQDLPAVVARLEQRGIRTILDLREVSHGWIYFFADNEDNVIQLYQPKVS